MSQLAIFADDIRFNGALAEIRLQGEWQSLSDVETKLAIYPNARLFIRAGDADFDGATLLVQAGNGSRLTDAQAIHDALSGGGGGTGATVAQVNALENSRTRISTDPAGTVPDLLWPTATTGDVFQIVRQPSGDTEYWTATGPGTFGAAPTFTVSQSAPTNVDDVGFIDRTGITTAPATGLVPAPTAAELATAGVDNEDDNVVAIEYGDATNTVVWMERTAGNWVQKIYKTDPATADPAEVGFVDRTAVTTVPGTVPVPSAGELTTAGLPDVDRNVAAIVYGDPENTVAWFKRIAGTWTQQLTQSSSTPETPTSYTIPAATAAAWVDPENPTDAELTAAYDVQRATDPVTVGDWIAVQGTTDAWQRLDGGGDGTLWRKDEGEAASLDARAYNVAAAANQRFTAPIPTDVGATEWGIGSDIFRTLSNGIKQLWIANTTTTVDATPAEAMPRRNEPLASVPASPMPTNEWKVGDSFWVGSNYYTVTGIAGDPNDLAAVDTDEDVAASAGGEDGRNIDVADATERDAISNLRQGDSVAVADDDGNGNPAVYVIKNDIASLAAGTANVDYRRYGTRLVNPSTGIDYANNFRDTAGGAGLTIEPGQRNEDRIVMDQALTLTAGTFVRSKPFRVQVENPTAGNLALALSGFTFYGSPLTEVAAGEFVLLQGVCINVGGANQFAVYSMTVGGTL